MRILVTGAQGQLGRELMSTLPASGHDAVGLSRVECDIAVPGDAFRTINRYQPSAVINCAGWTDVDGAEDHREAAFRANADGPRMLAQACSEAGSRLIHISSDFVFDGTATEPIPEDAEPLPLSVYGRSKRAGEAAVAELCPDHVIVRTSWLHGRHGRNFVGTILRLAREGGDLRVVSDQCGSPTWAGHLASALGRLLEGRRGAMYHLTNGGETTWHAFAEAILDEAAIPARVIAISTQQHPSRAPRPRYSVLDNSAWKRDGEPPLPHWRAGLSAHIRSLDAVDTA